MRPLIHPAIWSDGVLPMLTSSLWKVHVEQNVGLLFIYHDNMFHKKWFDFFYDDIFLSRVDSGFGDERCGAQRNSRRSELCKVVHDTNMTSNFANFAPPFYANLEVYLRYIIAKHHIIKKTGHNECSESCDTLGLVVVAGSVSRVRGLCDLTTPTWPHVTSRRTW